MSVNSIEASAHVMPADPNAWNPPNVAAIAAAAITMVLSIAQFALPHGSLLPPALLAMQYVAMGAMVLLHIVRHLGVRMAVAYFVGLSVLEFACEVFNILTHGLLYGSLEYTDLLGPEIAGVPIGVPIAMTFITWPIFTLMNLIVHRRVVVFDEGQGLGAIVVFGAICGFVESSLGFTTEPMMQALGAYRYPGVVAGVERDAYYGAPVMAQTGWMIVITILVVSLIKGFGPRFGRPRDVPLHGLLDSAPIVMFGVIVAGLALNAVELTQTMTTLWSGGVFALLGALALHHARAARRPQPPTAKP